MKLPKMPCWLIGHRPENALPIDDKRIMYEQTCINCGKRQTFEVNEGIRGHQSPWEKNPV